MKPESIIHSDLLDILFDNRNKDYGAYNLRKFYNNRLSKALLSTFSIALLFTISWFIHLKFFQGKKFDLAGLPATEVILKPFEEDKPKEKPKEQKPKAKSLTRQEVHTNIRIVPNDSIDKKVPEAKDLEGAKIGLVQQQGEEEIGIPEGPSDIFEGDGGGKEIEPVKEVPVVEQGPLMKAEIMPEFPGGMEALSKFMLRNLKEADDLDEGEKLVVLIKFVVQPDGEIDAAEVINNKSRYDSEVLRVVRKMPRWKPGVQNGTKVPVYFTLPITFVGPES